MSFQIKNFLSAYATRLQRDIANLIEFINLLFWNTTESHFGVVSGCHRIGQQARFVNRLPIKSVEHRCADRDSNADIGYHYIGDGLGIASYVWNTYLLLVNEQTLLANIGKGTTRRFELIHCDAPTVVLTRNWS